MDDAGVPVRALTLYPEWAGAVVRLGKRVENRSRPCPPAMIGQPVALHAGAKRRSLGLSRHDGLGEMVERAGWYQRGGDPPATWRRPGEDVCLAGVPVSAIVGLVRVTSCDKPQEGDLSGWRAPTLYGWRFDFHPIPYPIPCRGALGFWRVPESAAWHLHPQIPEDWR